MTPRLKLGVVFTSMLLTLMLVIGAVIGKSKDNEGAYRPLSVYSEVLAKIKSDYVEDPDMDKVTRGALQGLVEYLDGSSSYLTAEQYEEYQKALKNDDQGTGHSTGLVVHKRAGLAHVLGVLPGSAAAQAGIQVGDMIEAINSLSTRVMPPAYLRALLSGPSGSTVSLMVRPGRNTDEPKELTLTRAQAQLPDVSYKMLESAIGYIDVDGIDQERAKQVAEAIKSLEKSGARQFVLDLRDSSVGEPAEGILMADYFLDSGKVASLQGQRYPEKIFEAHADATVTKAEVVVIVARTTAGAAEVLAGAVMDSGRGEVVGERTYGNATEHETIKLDDGAALVLSVAKYHTPGGKAMQDEGITPSVPLSPAELRRYRDMLNPDADGDEPLTQPGSGSVEDPYLNKALEVLKNGAVKRAA